jgi:hypothetical protein
MMCIGSVESVTELWIRATGSIMSGELPNARSCRIALADPDIPLLAGAWFPTSAADPLSGRVVGFPGIGQAVGLHAPRPQLRYERFLSDDLGPTPVDGPDVVVPRIEVLVQELPM